MEKSDKVLTLSTIVLIGFSIAVLFHYFLGDYLGFSYPYNTFLYSPEQFASDFTILTHFIKDLNPYQTPSFWINYFPLAYIILFPLSLIKNNMVSYFVLLIIFECFWIPMNIKMFGCKNFNKIQNVQNIFILTALSYPLLNLVDRGNFDMILLIFMSGFIYLFQKKRIVASLLVLTVINAIKPFFILFLLLFLYKKKYKEVFLSLVLSFVLVIGGFLVFKGGLFSQIGVFLQSLLITKKELVYTIGGGLSNSSSLFMALKLIFCRDLNWITTKELAAICNIINIPILFIVGFFVYKEKIFWKQVALLTLHMLTFSLIVCDYKLIFLFIPIWLFVNVREKSKHDLIYTILFGLLLIPKRYLIILSGKLVSFSIILNPLIMLTLMGLIIGDQLCLKKKGNEND